MTDPSSRRASCPTGGALERRSSASREVRRVRVSGRARALDKVPHERIMSMLRQCARAAPRRSGDDRDRQPAQ